ncbi:MAG: DUF1232 domain-containing protein [Ruminococcaceae bacterium]|nr:DUF1232 domain-containing protein [Oscillospiraceae bacterium]
MFTKSKFKGVIKMTKQDKALTTNITTQEFTKQNSKSKKHYGLIAGIFGVMAIFCILSPIDFLPDMFLGLGQLDEIMMTCASIVTTCMAIKQKFTAENND